MLTLVASNIALAYRSFQLTRRIGEGESMVSDISERVTDTRRHALTREEFGALRSTLEDDLVSTVSRIRTLEHRADAASRIIAEASRSIVLLQGSFGFVHEESGRALRYVVDPDGDLVRSPLGGAAVSLDGTGPIAETHFTGTAFVVNEDGLLLTNRHVAAPWEGEDSVKAFATMGLVPVMHRFIGYLPGVEEPFDVEVVSASDDADLAVVRARADLAHVPHLNLSATSPKPGEEVIVMGYPTGFRALLARTEERVVRQLVAGAEVDPWRVARRLAREGRINPLASRGIVSQVADGAVVYDAETAEGGSGGPVLGLDGKVIAINAAILPEFSGSNMGVPVERAAQLLAAPGQPDAT